MTGLENRLKEENEGNIGSVCGQQWEQLTRTVERSQIIKTAHVAFANPDLRDRTSTRGGHHFGSPLRIEIDPDFFNHAHPARLQQLLGALAKGAYSRGVHPDFRHQAPLSVATGSPDARQAAIPPSRT
jgi:hypothetical protein